MTTAHDTGAPSLGIVFAARRTAVLRPLREARVGQGEVRIAALRTLVSSGTEITQYTGRFDPASHWASFAEYPAIPGYALAGVVVEIGTGVHGFAPGDRVVARAPHAARVVVSAEECTRIPPEVQIEDAAWFALAKIARMGVRAAGLGLGSRVAVVGAGPIGQMVTRWAVAAGCIDVAVIDPIGFRLELARGGGADRTISDDVVVRSAEVARALGTPPDVVIDTTGNALVFEQALSLVADRGRVIVLGDTGFPRSQHLSSDVITRGLTIVGAHDGDSGGWAHDRIHHDLFFALVASGRFSLAGLTTHVFAPAEAQTVYAGLADRMPHALGVQFDWGTAP